MASETIPVTLSYDGSRFHYSGEHVRPWPDENGPYTSITLPRLAPDTKALLLIEAIGGLQLGTSPVEWVGLNPADLTELFPIQPDPSRVAVVPGDATHVAIEIAVQEQAAGYRFLLVTFHGGRALIADPTIIDPPKG